MATREEQLAYSIQQRDLALALIADPVTPEYSKPNLLSRVEFFNLEIKRLELG